MPDLSGSIYSELDASNSEAAPNGMPEGMPPSGVNDAWRAGMGALKRFWGRIQGVYASTGSANAYVLSPDVDLAAYVTGERYSFRSNFANTGACTLNISSLGTKSIKVMGTSGKADPASGDIQDGQSITVEYDGTDMVMVTPPASSVTGFVVGDLSTKTIPTASDSVVIMDAADSSKAKTGTIAHLLSGSVAQVVVSEDGAVATGTTVMPSDDTIPQNTEGNQYMSVSITPTSLTSTLLIDIVFNGTISIVGQLVVALFQDTTPGALAAVSETIDVAADKHCISFRHKMTAGTTSATTFKVRAGPNSAATLTFNGSGGSRLLGGVMASSIAVTEIRP
jgi:hypothetical protein